MTSPASPPSPPPPSSRSTPRAAFARHLALRASGSGVLFAGALAILGWVLTPERLLAVADRSAAGAGVFAALAAGIAGNLLLAAAAARPPEDPDNSSGFLRAVVLDFALQLLVVVAGVMGMFLLDVKFQRIAAFGVAFVVVATTFRIASSLVIARALGARSAARVRGGA